MSSANVEHLLDPKLNIFLEAAPDAIVVVDSNGRIVMVNQLTEIMFGYTREELLNAEVEMLVPDDFRQAHVKSRKKYTHHPITRPMGAGRALTGRKKDGTEFPVEISLSPLNTEQGTLITSIIRDITDRRRVEQQIQASLREKEALLKEIHHRVKNNLQVISSLLRLQSEYIQDVAERELFAESQNRIRSMALVHEKLYKSNDLSRINFAEYVESLAALLFRSFGIGSRINFNIQGDSIFLSVEKAVPCGLIVNELLSNCFKHAFPDKNSGEINVKLDTAKNNQYILIIEDDGVGLPTDFSLEKAETLGLQLVKNLVNQLDGVIDIIKQPKTCFKITFYENKGSNE